MKKLIFRRDTCRLCESKDLYCVLSLSPTPIGEGYVREEALNVKQEMYPVDLFLCKDCGHVQLLDIIEPVELYRYYIYKTSHSLGLVNHFDKYAEWVITKLNLSNNNLVVDIGSNDGSLLKAFKKKGMKVIGVDPAVDIAKEATNAGVKTYADFFTGHVAEKIKIEEGQSMVITMNNAFANIDDLDEVIKGIKILMAKEGVFIFETGYVFDVLQKIIFDNIYHEHLSYFSVKSAQKFFLKHDLEIIDIEHVPTKGGSIRCIVQFKNGPKKIQTSVSDFLTLESDLSTHNLKTYKTFEKNINLIKYQTYTLIKSLKSKGKKIIGYGASITVTGVLFNFNLDNSLIDFIVDDNPVRQNLYSPGMHIPVYSSEKIHEYNPDYIIVLAWQYAEPIISRNQKYLKNGGNFIVFQPQLRIINKYNYDE
jgi:SAM-dependent methyltransferase